MMSAEADEFSAPSQKTAAVHETRKGLTEDGKTTIPNTEEAGKKLRITLKGVDR
jgi:hypothetical protein